MFAGYTPSTFRPRLSPDEYARLDAKIEADIERDSRDGKCGIDHDVSLRHFFKAQHAKSMGPDSILVDEVEVFGGRIDLLAIEPTHMAGVEIKADRDTLTRLPAQAKAFSAILDQVTLLTTRRHLLAILCAERTFAAPIPPWWGIIEAVEADDGEEGDGGADGPEDGDRGRHPTTLRDPRRGRRPGQRGRSSGRPARISSRPRLRVRSAGRGLRAGGSKAWRRR